MTEQSKRSAASSKRLLKLSAQGLHPSQSEKAREAFGERIRTTRQVCEHCNTEGSIGMIGKHHGNNCPSLTSYILATHKVTGETRTYKTVPQAEADTKTNNIYLVLSGRHSKPVKGWFFERIAIGSL